MNLHKKKVNYIVRFDRNVTRKNCELVGFDRDAASKMVATFGIFVGSQWDCSGI